MFWLKNGELIDASRDINFIISNEGNLIISQTRLGDAANYTCGAQNIASRRLSEAALLTVYGSFSPKSRASHRLTVVSCSLTVTRLCS